MLEGRVRVGQQGDLEWISLSGPRAPAASPEGKGEGQGDPATGGAKCLKGRTSTLFSLKSPRFYIREK